MRPEDCAHSNRGPAPGLDEICPDCNLAAPELPPPGESGRLVGGPDFQVEAVGLLVTMGMQPGDHRSGMVAERLRGAYERGLRADAPDYQAPVVRELEGARALYDAWNLDYGNAVLRSGQDWWELTLSTGGWSDNEHALAEFRRAQPLWWMSWWMSSSRGGSHTFGRGKD